MTDGPVILSSYDSGKHNADLDAAVSRLDADLSWKDLSCIMITPAAETVPVKVLASWESMMTPPNNKFTRIYTIKCEVGEAYTKTIEAILAHPELSSWKYICTREHDNAMPPDGLVKLLRQMENHPEYAAIGGLYFTKGPGGVAQIWGDPGDHPLHFRPQPPDPSGGLKPCNGTGMGFTVFRLSLFKDERLRRPWFKTSASREEGMFSQDLYFWADAFKHGYRAAVDCSIKVGHYDLSSDIMW